MNDTPAVVETITPSLFLIGEFIQTHAAQGYKLDTKYGLHQDGWQYRVTMHKAAEATPTPRKNAKAAA